MIQVKYYLRSIEKVGKIPFEVHRDTSTIKVIPLDGSVKLEKEKWKGRDEWNSWKALKSVMNGTHITDTLLNQQSSNWQTDSKTLKNKKNWDKAVTKNPLLEKNVPSDEMQEIQLISAIAKKTVISLPDIETINDEEYNKLYGIAFEKMPESLIAAKDSSLKKKKAKKFTVGKKKRVILQRSQSQSDLPYVAVEKLDLTKLQKGQTVKKFTRYRIMIETNKYTRISLLPASGKIKTIKISKIQKKNETGSVRFVNFKSQPKT